MKKSKITFVLFSAAAFTVAGSSIPSARAADPQNHGGMTAMDGKMADPNLTQLNQSNTESVRKLLAQITDYAVSNGKQEDLIDDLVKADRDRFNNLKDVNWSDLNGRIDQFRKDWTAKYGHEFDAKDNMAAVFNDEFRCYAGMVSVNDLPSGKTGPGENKMPVGGNPNKETVDQATVIFPHEQTAAAPLDKAKRAMDATKPVYVHVFNEGKVGGMLNAWKIDVPDDMNSQKLHDALLAKLTDLDEHKDKWPSDVNQGYRAVAECIFSVLTGEPAPTH